MSNRRKFLKGLVAAPAADAGAVTAQSAPKTINFSHTVTGRVIADVCAICGHQWNGPKCTHSNNLGGDKFVEVDYAEVELRAFALMQRAASRQ